jgi:hypothetical protein
MEWWSDGVMEWWGAVVVVLFPTTAVRIQSCLREKVGLSPNLVSVTAISAVEPFALIIEGNKPNRMTIRTFYIHTGGSATDLIFGGRRRRISPFFGRIQGAFGFFGKNYLNVLFFHFFVS